MNEEDGDFDKKLEKWGVGNYFLINNNLLQESWELILKIGGIFLWRKNNQRTRTHVLSKYGRLYLYYVDFEKIYSIDDEDIHFVKVYGYALIGNP